MSKTAEIVELAAFRRRASRPRPSASEHTRNEDLPAGGAETMPPADDVRHQPDPAPDSLPRGAANPFVRGGAAARPALQSGVLAYRRTAGGGLLILLVSMKRSKQWGIPKGGVEPHLSFWENAAKEAFEEAGVRGRISPNSVGMFRATKRTSTRSKRVIEVWVYLLEVTERLSNWPEKGKRRTKWVSWQTAARQLREPLLSDLCRRVAQGQRVL